MFPVGPSSPIGQRNEYIQGVDNHRLVLNVIHIQGVPSILAFILFLNIPGRIQNFPGGGALIPPPLGLYQIMKLIELDHMF